MFWQVGKSQDDPNLKYRMHSDVVEWHAQGWKKNRNNKEFVTFAEDLEKEGNQLYLKADYYHAYRKYDDSRVYLPTPKIMFLVGDSQMRFKLANIEHAIKVGDHSAQCWPPIFFAYDVSEILTESYETGFDLIKQLKLDDVKSTPLYKRAYSSAFCLQKLASKEGGYHVKPHTCVDAKEIKACLGKPLPIK